MFVQVLKTEKQTVAFAGRLVLLLRRYKNLTPKVKKKIDTNIIPTKQQKRKECRSVIRKKKKATLPKKL